MPSKLYRGPAGSGSGGLSITRSTTSESNTISVPETSGIIDSTLSLTINVSGPDEIIMGEFIGSAKWATGDDVLVNAFVYYQVDGGTDVKFAHTQVGDPTGLAGGNEAGYNPISPLNSTFSLTGLSAGSHTIKIRLEATGANRVWNLNGPELTSRFTIIQFA